MTASNSRCTGGCPCGDTKKKAPKGGITKTAARVVMACWASLPAGAIASIATGDPRSVGIGLVLAVTATAWAVVAHGATQKAADQ